MAEITYDSGWLKNPAGDKFAPITTTDQVITKDGNALGTELNDLIEANAALVAENTELKNQIAELNSKFIKGYKIAPTNSYASQYFDSNDQSTVSVVDGIVTVYVSIKIIKDFPANGTIGFNLPKYVGDMQLTTVDYNHKKLWSIQTTGSSFNIFTDSIIPANSWIRFSFVLPI